MVYYKLIIPHIFCILLILLQIINFAILYYKQNYITIINNIILNKYFSSIFIKNFVYIVKYL